MLCLVRIVFNMAKRDFFITVLNQVCESMELTCDDVLHSNKDECVDARYLVVSLLSERLSDRQIADVSGWSYALVNKARNSFSERCKFRWGLKGLYKNLCNFVSCKEQ